MEHLLEKLSQYHILNNMIPGVVFLYTIDLIGIYTIILDNVICILFIGYFAGMILSRIGSVVIEPWFKNWHIVNYADFNDFLNAEKSDPKIQSLLADNNMYRTIVAMLLLIIILYVGHLIPIIDRFLHSDWFVLVVIAILLILYVLAYNKQTTYIRKRVLKANNKKGE